MTKKRFVLQDLDILCRVLDNGKPINGIETVNLLNALHDENVKLQARNKYLATKIQRERNIHVKEHEKWENEIQKENEKLKQSVNNLKDTIIKITLAYQRKYDRTIVDLVDEVHEEDITDLIKELKEIGDYQEGRIKELNDENEHLEFELEKVVEVCRKYGIYKEELQYVLADYDKMLNENGERAIRYKYCVNSR